MRLTNWGTRLGAVVLSGILSACACQTTVPAQPDTSPPTVDKDKVSPEPVVIPVRPIERPDEVGLSVREDADGIRIVEDGTKEVDTSFFFSLDDSALSSMTIDVLRKHAEVLKANPNLKIMIAGHCDERGTREYNLALGDRRAEAVERFLLSAGVAASQMDTVSFGEEIPIDTASNEAAWAKNRRAEIKYQN